MENSKLNEREQIKPINKTNKGESDLCKNSKMLYVRYYQAHYNKLIFHL